MKKQKSDFRLIGLSAGKGFTLELLDTDKEIFWAENGLEEGRYRELFKWAKSDDTFWKNKWIAEVQHDGIFEDGGPKNGVVVGVREWDL